ncbi:hypothetical protein Z043_116671, partial [Scleropages formosus]
VRGRALEEAAPPRALTTPSLILSRVGAAILGVRQCAERRERIRRRRTMVHTCVVVGCRNRRTPGTTLSFYRFPRDPERKQRWIAAVNRQGWQPNDGSRLCSTHFISGGSGQVLEAGPRAEPFPERGGAEASGCPDAPARPADGEPRAEGPAPSPCSDSAADCEEEVARLRREVRALRELAERSSLTEAALRADPEKVRFYTGLPSFFVLETVLWLLSPHLRADKGLKLSKFQQLLLALMRLRLDLRNQDLAYRFGVQVAAVARTVRAVVEAMSSTLVPTTVFWPSRDELRRNLPAAFVILQHSGLGAGLPMLWPPGAPQGRWGRAGEGEVPTCHLAHILVERGGAAVECSGAEADG